jgi:Flp pilus assembly pilin Flp
MGEDNMFDLFLRIWIAVVDGLDRSERGQTTAEYALVLIAAAAIGGLVLAWATKTHAVSGLFDKIVNRVTDLVA